ncbi:MAG: GLPGLI family protein [Bacteroides sp.]
MNRYLSNLLISILLLLGFHTVAQPVIRVVYGNQAATEGSTEGKRAITYTLYAHGAESVSIQGEPELKDGKLELNDGSYIYLNLSDSLYLMHGSAITSWVFVKEQPVKMLEWTVHDETTPIAGKVCRRATAEEQGGATIEAWFCDEIPVPFGPNRFFGAPGLIMEVTFGAQYYRAMRVEYLPSDNFKIQLPEVKNTISRKEYHDRISETIQNLIKQTEREEDAVGAD